MRVLPNGSVAPTKLKDLIMQVLAIIGHEVCNALTLLVDLECWHKPDLTKGFDAKISVRVVDINDYQGCVRADFPAQGEVALLHGDACSTKFRSEHHHDLRPVFEQDFPFFRCLNEERSAITLGLAFDSRMALHVDARGWKLELKGLKYKQPATIGHEVCNLLTLLVNLECWYKRNLTKGFDTQISVRSVDINDYQGCVRADFPAQGEVALLHGDACSTKFRSEHHHDLRPVFEQDFPFFRCLNEERSAITLGLAFDSRMALHVDA
eukprot:CAMPEP_0172791702 /NCGR_PEP_ID=MMETSP1074-20121228/208602_1 /TAXON_ID=2916 /ORGANISM="Ceratium fusus, Strain PA161109" /LENGTH=265 /DNA_ID=CAMNT_0013628761 /DNA_START=167 /DNA_END=962 /DNA_ORIENTATION=-